MFGPITRLLSKLSSKGLQNYMWGFLYAKVAELLIDFGRNRKL